MAHERRICSFTNTPISNTDRASVQMAFAKLDSDGRAEQENILLDISGDISKRGKVDLMLTEYMRNLDE